VKKTAKKAEKEEKKTEEKAEEKAEKAEKVTSARPPFSAPIYHFPQIPSPTARHVHVGALRPLTVNLRRPSPRQRPRRRRPLPTSDDSLPAVSSIPGSRPILFPLASGYSHPLCLLLFPG
jgi:hypothetical protein